MVYTLPPVYGPTTAIPQLLDPSIYTSRFKDLPQNGKIAAEYVWIGGTGADLRSKARTLDFIPKDPSELPHWNYDGSSCGQAPGTDSEVYLVPRAIYKDPFRGGDNIIVLADQYNPPSIKEDGTLSEITPIPTNTRAPAAVVMDKVLDEDVWFGIEQEYTLLNTATKWPLGEFCSRCSALFPSVSG